MENTKRLNRDYFGVNEKSLFEREYNYHMEGEVPYNAIIVDSKGNCYMAGECEGISKHFVFGGDCRVWLNDGTYKIMSLSQISRLSEDKIRQIPKNNFVFKVEKNALSLKKECFHFNPYEKHSKGICFNFYYDKSSLIELVFMSHDFCYKYFGNNLPLKRTIEVYKDVYEAYLKAEDSFDRVVLARILKKLEKSDKYYASIESVGYEYEFNFIKKLYESKNIDWISVEQDLFNLSFMDSLYGMEQLQRIKNELIVKNDAKLNIKNLKDFKNSLMFPGICEDTVNLINPLPIKSFYTDDEILTIAWELSVIDKIENYTDFMKSLSLFDSKMIKIEDFKNFMTQLLDKSIFMDKSIVNMMKDLMEVEDLTKLTHAIYSGELYNVSVLNGKKMVHNLHFSLRQKEITLNEIEQFYVVDTKKMKSQYEERLLSKIHSSYRDTIRRKENKKSSDLCLYKELIKGFHEEFLNIKDFNIGFNFENELLTQIFEYAKSNKDLLLEVLEGEVFGRLDKKEYISKIKVENEIFSIIKKFY